MLSPGGDRLLNPVARAPRLRPCPRSSTGGDAPWSTQAGKRPPTASRSEARARRGEGLCRDAQRPHRTQRPMARDARRTARQPGQAHTSARASAGLSGCLAGLAARRRGPRGGMAEHPTNRSPRTRSARTRDCPVMGQSVVWTRKRGAVRGGVRHGRSRCQATRAPGVVVAARRRSLDPHCVALVVHPTAPPHIA